MKAYALLALALAGPALAQTTPAPATDVRSPAEAAQAALALCSEHASAKTPLEASSARQIDAKGLKYQHDAPEFLASTESGTLGRAQYAKSPSTQGEIWAAGYDSSACMVFALATPAAEAEKGFTDFFTQSGTWRAERVTSSARPGERLLRFGWNQRRNLKLTAIVSLRDADNVSTVTITRSTG
jgi:hypothetical protein